MIRSRHIIALCLLLFPFTASAARADDRPTVIVIIGAPGEPAYGAAFIKSADRWADAAKLASAHFISIGPTSVDIPSTAPAPATAPAGPSDKQLLKDALDAAIKETSQPLWLVFLGHGTDDGRAAKFNLRGDDISDQELATWLTPCIRPTAVIDCSSSSAPFLNRLSKKSASPSATTTQAAPPATPLNRVIITATRTGREVNYSRFGQYLAEAIADPSADLDKDGQTSLLEAFLAASHRVADFYKNEGRLATEHPLIDDNSDGLGTSSDFFDGIRPTRAARTGAPVDGPRANQWVLIPSPAELAMTPEARARRNEIELQIESLRAKKSTLPESDYYAQLDTLLLTLAKVYQPPSK